MSAPDHPGPDHVPGGPPEPGPAGLLRAYRFMAGVVGVLLVVLCLVGSDPQRLGDAISTYLGVAHGWLYMIFVVVAFVLSRRERWSLGFTLGTLLAGTVPILSFWAERRATRAVLAAHPDLQEHLGTPATQQTPRPTR